MKIKKSGGFSTQRGAYVMWHHVVCGNESAWAWYNGPGQDGQTDGGAHLMINNACGQFNMPRYYPKH